MKSVNQNIFSFILCSLFVFGFSITALGQPPSSKSTQSGSAKSDQSEVAQSDKSVVTFTMKVPGVCEMCKARIESTAMDVPGVKKAEWDVQTDTLVLVGSSKMNAQRVADALAKAGYRSDLAKADPKGYNKLPACCQYDSGLEKH